MFFDVPFGKSPHGAIAFGGSPWVAFSWRQTPEKLACAFLESLQLRAILSDRPLKLLSRLRAEGLAHFKWNSGLPLICKS